MIAPDHDFGGAPLLRREFTLDSGYGEVTSATLRLSALGVCEAVINAEQVSEDVLTPGWSSYEWRLRYIEHDVLDLLAETNVIGIALGNGWYRGRLGWTGAGALYGDELGTFAELRITFEDGHIQLISTDDKWTAGPSATTSNDLYDGQSIDARLRNDAWMVPGFSHPSWVGVHALDFDTGKLAPYIGPTVVRQEELAPTAVWASPAGATLMDFGQNLVGWLKITVQGRAGDVITVRHAEVLEHEELGIRPLRTAQASDRFVLSGGLDQFEPTFTLHGFRYAQIEGWRDELGELADSVRAVVVSSELHRTGYLKTSDELLNRFHENVLWGMKGNFVDVPTDCPQRDERLGWTGDIAVFAPTASFLYDTKGFLSDWLADLALEQQHHAGVVPFVVPDAIKLFAGGTVVGDWAASGAPTAAWSDAAVWVPWALWEAYGDEKTLSDHFESMASHVRCVMAARSSDGVWDTGFQFGDWLDPDAPPEDAFAAKADPGVVATACAFRSADLTAKAAAQLGRTKEQKEFEDAAAGLRLAFNNKYVENGKVHSDCTTAYSVAIVFGLLDEADMKAAGGRLAELVEASQFRISTGFVGTPFITDALTLTGNVDLAYRLLLERGCPSWLYPVTMGATTVWERWDSMLPDGTVNPGEMTSFNHYALGSVADWMHRTIGGIAPASPGYKSAIIAPRPGGGITWAEASLETPQGVISVHWELSGRDLTVSVSVPEGTEAVLRLPGRKDQTLATGKSVWHVTDQDVDAITAMNVF
ncbi:alpha-L-rhamnosidase [Paenarthrobacter sp. A20]|uniref:alpha-L-rhamnosidase n=1 Tax=Paenarthrobacter sp. A20 TaxID=2817891 RepID=UPI00209D7268|nr:alpha-L-rhamnosidase [Paenarthrobacter sp. A20]MCP1415569.1 alpha-L-rhamnosidase [Paenarthrobacter sp. A20]